MTMRVRAQNSAFAIAASVIVSVHAQAALSAACHNAELRIPRPAPGSIGGREFARYVEELEGCARDAEVRREFLAGNLTENLPHLAAVTLEARGRAMSM